MLIQVLIHFIQLDHLSCTLTDLLPGNSARLGSIIITIASNHLWNFRQALDIFITDNLKPNRDKEQ